MTRADRILTALKALVVAAAPAAAVSGFTEDTSKAATIGAGGAIIGGTGDHGEPEYDLSPLTYTYSFRVTVEAILPAAAGDTALRGMIAPIGAMVQADRSLGGRCNWLDVSPPTLDSENEDGAAPLRVATFDFIAEYTVSDPLGE